MIRLTYSKPNGEFGIEGIDIKELDTKLYSAICKLKYYEDIGLNPDEVKRMKDECWK